MKLHGDAPLPTPIPNTFFLKMNAAFSEMGNSFGFSMGRCDPARPPWVVFVDDLRVHLWGPFRSMKAKLVRVYEYTSHWCLANMTSHLRQKQARHHGSFSGAPGGVSPGSSPGGSFSYPQNYQGKGSSSYNLSDAGKVNLDNNWVIIKTVADEYFIEYVGKAEDLEYFPTGGDCKFPLSLN